MDFAFSQHSPSPLVSYSEAHHPQPYAPVELRAESHVVYPLPVRVGLPPPTQSKLAHHVPLYHSCAPAERTMSGMGYESVGDPRPLREPPGVYLRQQRREEHELFQPWHYDELRAIDAFVTELTEYYLDDDNINKHKGSVPVERIQNKVRHHLEDKSQPMYNKMYGKLIGSEGPPMTMYTSWKQFVKNHPDKFEYLEEPGKNGAKEGRLRLLKHAQNNDADEKEKKIRGDRDTHWKLCLKEYLLRPGSQEKEQSTLDKFLEAWDDLKENKKLKETQFEKPHRGDLKRFVVKSPDFVFEKRDNYHLISISQAASEMWSGEPYFIQSFFDNNPVSSP
eukprot:TRINITY_DN9908_c0_g1_i1.p1 TRINITY_DN9908_c0_g1~~TRINITY_DN9908_c0_g1_i1.p1  ORF type:complete len:335 (+),score=47.71 TRINITY_DN9908_c0_g1_i1:169-1173(+)